MPTKKYKPTTPARRNMTVPAFEEITKYTPKVSYRYKEARRTQQLRQNHSSPQGRRQQAEVQNH